MLGRKERWTSGVIGLIFLILGQSMTVRHVWPWRQPDNVVSIPIGWPALSAAGWLALVFLFLALAQLAKAIMGVAYEKRTRLNNAGLWVGVFLIAFLFTIFDDHLPEPIVGVAPTLWWIYAAIILVPLAVAFWLGRSSVNQQSEGRGRKVVIHAVLIFGGIIFLIPFVWMLITSVKDERALLTAGRLELIPKVQPVHEYLDEAQPVVSARYNGQRVRAKVLEDRGETLFLEVQRPYGVRGRRFEANASQTERLPNQAKVVLIEDGGQEVRGFVAQDLPDGSQVIELLTPEREGERVTIPPGASKPLLVPGMRWENYSEALEWMPQETFYGWTYLRSSLILVVMSVIGTILSCSLVAYGFSRLRFPGRDALFAVMLATMMLPAAVTMLPQFLIFRWLGWIDTLLPLWVPTFFASAFNVFLLRQFFKTIPMELEDAAKIDGASFLQTWWRVMMPLVKPALAAIAIWTFMGAWNNFMGPLIYISSPEKMPIAYALQLFTTERGGSFELMMAFAAMATIPVILLFFFAQRWFIEGVQLSGLGGR